MTRRQLMRLFRFRVYRLVRFRTTAKDLYGSVLTLIFVTIAAVTGSHCGRPAHRVRRTDCLRCWPTRRNDAHRFGATCGVAFREVDRISRPACRPAAF